MLSCTCEIDDEGFVIWDIYCPVHGKLNETKGGQNDGKE